MLLTVSELSKTYGADIVLEGVGFRMDRREKVALVGRNGSGKTTLLRVIAGELEPDGGGFHLSRGAKVGYLKQEYSVGTGRTVIEEAESALERELALKKRLVELERKLEDDPSDEDLDEYALVHEHFMEVEGYSAEHDVRTVLQRMGFCEADFGKITDSLSGGEKTRLAIARILLEEPDLLILDEPTNHLDLQATEWLEDWIRKYHGAVLLVTHDREFLQNTAERVLEIRDHNIESFDGPFDKYLQQRAERDERQAVVAAQQAQEIARLDEYVRRFMNSQRTAQARGRLKKMNKLIAAKVDAPRAERDMKAGFGRAKRSGDIVVECRGLAVGFDDETLFDGFDWTVRWGERWGVIGENGSGKSTLVRTFLGQHPAVSGDVRMGSNIEVGYFSQDTVDIDMDLTPLQFISYECGLEAAVARDLLGRFLIEGDDVFRRIKTLSGGEKNKLALARLTQLEPNLLVLDEPTNHLDIASSEALASILKAYRGTLVLVSHDRWLLRQVCDNILDVRRAGPVVTLGSYDDYVRRSRPNGSPTVQQNDKEASGSAMSQRELSKAIQRAREELAASEQEVARREGELAELVRLLTEMPPDLDMVGLTHRHTEASMAVDQAVTDWESRSQELECLLAKQG